MYYVEAISHKGQVRSENEDMLLIGRHLIRDGQYAEKLPNDWQGLLAVADGMGGQAAGEVAAQRCLEMLLQWYDAEKQMFNSVNFAHLAEQEIISIGLQLNREGRLNPEHFGMGTTLTGISFIQQGLYFYHVGDSRLYRWREGRVEQLTRDHTLAETLGDPHISSNILSNCLGGNVEPYVDAGLLVPMVEKDVFLICSDGLTDMVPDDLLAQLIPKGGEDLLRQALINGGADNISFILVTRESE